MTKNYRRGLNFTQDQAIKLDIIAGATDRSIAKLCRDMIDEQIDRYMAGIRFTYNDNKYEYYFLDPDSYAPVVCQNGQMPVIPPPYIDVWQKLLSKNIRFRFDIDNDFHSVQVHDLEFITLKEALFK